MELDRATPCEPLKPCCIDDSSIAKAVELTKQRLAESGSQNPQAMNAALRAYRILLTPLAYGAWDCTRVELATLLERSPNAVTRVLNRLERAGAIHRRVRGCAGLRLLLLIRPDALHPSRLAMSPEDPCLSTCGSAANIPTPESQLLAAAEFRLHVALERGRRIRDESAYLDAVIESLRGEPDQIAKILRRRARAAAAKARRKAEVSHGLSLSVLTNRLGALCDEALRPAPESRKFWQESMAKMLAGRFSKQEIFEQATLWETLNITLNVIRPLKAALSVEPDQLDAAIDRLEPNLSMVFADALDTVVSWHYLVQPESQFQDFLAEGDHEEFASAARQLVSLYISIAPESRS